MCRLNTLFFFWDVLYLTVADWSTQVSKSSPSNYQLIKCYPVLSSLLSQLFLVQLRDKQNGVDRTTKWILPGRWWDINKNRSYRKSMDQRSPALKRFTTCSFYEYKMNIFSLSSSPNTSTNNRQSTQKLTPDWLRELIKCVVAS